MKYIGAIFFCLAFFTMQGQDIAPKVTIDTIQFNYNYVGVETYDVSYPQLQIEGHDYAASLINADIRTYFDSDTLVIYNGPIKDGFTIEEVISERKELLGEDMLNRPDKFSQGFELSYLDGNLVSILVSNNVFPAGGQIMFDSYGLQYNLLTGKKLEIDDFLDITPRQLTDAFLKYGYQVDQENERVIKSAIDRESFELDKHVESLVSKRSDGKTDCTDFYFKKEGNNIHLMLRLECAEPFHQDIGISLEYLKPYITYYEFKNHYTLWGKDISQLIGKEISTTKTGVHIQFDSYDVTEGGGYIIENNKNISESICAINYWHSGTEIFYVFTVKKQGAENFRVTDVLAIPSEDVVKYKLVDSSCETAKGGDPEIIALVKDKDNPEYYTKIVKAWRANSKTGKFEIIKPKKVKRCGNEGYGADED